MVRKTTSHEKVAAWLVDQQKVFAQARRAGKLTAGRNKLCPYCDHRTEQNSNMQTHIRARHTKQRLSCELCEDYTNPDPSCIIKHKKAKHGYLPAPRAARRKDTDYSKAETPVPLFGSQSVDAVEGGVLGGNSEPSGLVVTSTGQALPTSFNYAGELFSEGCGGVTHAGQRPNFGGPGEGVSNPWMQNPPWPPISSSVPSGYNSAHSAPVDAMDVFQPSAFQPSYTMPEPFADYQDILPQSTDNWEWQPQPDNSHSPQDFMFTGFPWVDVPPSGSS